MKRRGAFATACCALALLAGAGARAREDTGDEMARMKTVAAEIARLERVMDGYYRGETLHAALERLNAKVDEHNALAESRNRELDESGKPLDSAREPVEKLKAEIDRMDAALKREPDPSDRAAVNAYNALVRKRNAAVKRFNSMNDDVNARVKRHNARVKQVKAEIERSSRSLDASRAGYKRRKEALERFEKSGDDLAFFESVNRLLARVLAESRRADSDDGWAVLAAKPRALRRELGERAAGEHGRKEHGLVIVEATVSREACWLIVDTGAMRTTIGPGMVEALGFSGKLGEEVELNLAGGVKTKGRELTLPSIEVSGTTERDVPAAAVKVSDVGVDGLLGQSFLKRFVYTIDESKKTKLILRRREAF